MSQNILLKSCRELLVCFMSLLIVNVIYAQHKKAKVLFIGNSYTYVNDLPKLVADMAASTGDTLEYDMSAPGAATFYNHCRTIPATTEKIKAGGWDYVVLQEQSEEPATSPNYFYHWVYPFARQLDSLVNVYNPCAETIFYMTWGRKNGDPPRCPGPSSWFFFCTYLGMDSVLRARYMLMTEDNRATVSPVGAVWRYIRVNYPGIELYDADESHPSPAGSYAGACSFYTAIFKKPADNIKYNFSLSATDAATIRQVATKVVFDSLSFWHIGQYETIAAFADNANGKLPVSFTNKSVNAVQYKWNFGDGQTSTEANPSHTYALPDIYTVQLVSIGTSCSDTAYARITVTGDLDPGTFVIAPNPATDKLYIKSDLFGQDNYRIQMLNIVGQPVYDRQASGEIIQSINVSGLPGGVYIMNIYTNKKIYRKKVVIQ